jgi:hypothetical protein
MLEDIRRGPAIDLASPPWVTKLGAIKYLRARAGS